MTARKPTLEDMRKFRHTAQEHQRDIIEWLCDPALFKRHITDVCSVAVIEGNEIVAIAATVPYMKDYANCWVVLRERPGKQHLAMTRILIRVLDALNRRYRALFVYPEIGFPEREKFIRILGFERTNKRLLAGPDFIEMRRTR